MNRELKIGITEQGVLHTDAEPPYDLDTKFRMVKEAGIYEYFDKTPPAGQADEYRRCSRSVLSLFQILITAVAQSTRSSNIRSRAPSGFARPGVRAFRVFNSPCLYLPKC
jgi:hypothetical protein